MESGPYLDEILKEERLAITYKSLSRKLGINVNEAKVILKEYLASNMKAIKALYFIQRETPGGLEISLGDESKLEELHGRKVEFSFHVYSLHPSVPRSSDGLLLIDTSVARSDTFEEVKQCRVIKSESITQRIVAIMANIREENK